MAKKTKAPASKSSYKGASVKSWPAAGNKTKQAYGKGGSKKSGKKPS
jgi:hypothetical protein